MSCFRRLPLIVISVLAADGLALSQQAPSVPQRAWDASSVRPHVLVPARRSNEFLPDSEKVYALSELVDIAERNNPETRVAWENAKARAADLGIAKATLYPTMAAAALAESARYDIFVGQNFYRQTTETFSPAFVLDYTVFDFGKRSQAIAISRTVPATYSRTSTGIARTRRPC